MTVRSLQSQTISPGSAFRLNEMESLVERCRLKAPLEKLSQRCPAHLFSHPPPPGAGPLVQSTTDQMRWVTVASCRRTDSAFKFKPSRPAKRRKKEETPVSVWNLAHKVVLSFEAYRTERKDKSPAEFYGRINIRTLHSLHAVFFWVHVLFK